MHGLFGPIQAEPFNHASTSDEQRSKHCPQLKLCAVFRKSQDLMAKSKE
jgi:hypothetical protein